MFESGGRGKPAFSVESFRSWVFLGSASSHAGHGEGDFGISARGAAGRRNQDHALQSAFVLRVSLLAEECGSEGPSLEKPALGALELYRERRNQGLHEEGNQTDAGSFATGGHSNRDIHDLRGPARAQRISFPLSQLLHELVVRALRKSLGMVSWHHGAKEVTVSSAALAEPR